MTPEQQEALVRADGCEEAGDWARACWHRLCAWRGPDSWRRPLRGGDTYITVWPDDGNVWPMLEVLLPDSGWAVAWPRQVFGSGQGEVYASWPAGDWRTYRTLPAGRDFSAPPTPEVRAACELASRYALRALFGGEG